MANPINQTPKEKTPGINTPSDAIQKASEQKKTRQRNCADGPIQFSYLRDALRRRQRAISIIVGKT